MSRPVPECHSSPASDDGEESLDLGQLSFYPSRGKIQPQLHHLSDHTTPAVNLISDSLLAKKVDRELLDSASSSFAFKPVAESTPSLFLDAASKATSSTLPQQSFPSIEVSVQSDNSRLPCNLEPAKAHSQNGTSLHLHTDFSRSAVEKDSRATNISSEARATDRVAGNVEHSPPLADQQEEDPDQRVSGDNNVGSAPFEDGSSSYLSSVENIAPDIIPTTVNLLQPGVLLIDEDLMGYPPSEGLLRLFMSTENAALDILLTTGNLLEHRISLAYPTISDYQAVLEGYNHFDYSSSDLNTILNFGADDLHILSPFFYATLAHVFLDNSLVRDSVCVKEEMGNGELGVMGKEMQLKRKFEMPEL
ncbi:hypothetical protein LguiA_003993 [Lonicera macranthoides]